MIPLLLHNLTVTHFFDPLVWNVWGSECEGVEEPFGGDSGGSIFFCILLFSLFNSIGALFLGARAPLELARVKNKRMKSFRIAISWIW